MWILDSNGQHLEANEAACKLYGFTQEEFALLSAADLQAPEDARRFLTELNNPAHPAASEWRHRTKDGRWIDVEIALHHIDFGGDAELAVLMDVTGRRQLEDQLRQSQKMEALGLLTGGVAHDFNNLLTIITGYSQIILGKLPPGDPNRHFAELIVKAAERAGELTSRLLQFSRRRVPQARVVDLNQVVNSLGTMMRRLLGEEIELDMKLASDLGNVNADTGRIEQVLLNLAVNSRDAMPHGGTLTIETTNVRVEKRGAVRPGAYVALTVRDTGTGMDAVTQAHAFEPFFTTKREGSGTGLGLYTVAGIVKQSGGAVELHSQPGEGTSFRIYLPRVDQAPAAAPARVPKVAAAAGGVETILLVEDDDMVRALVRETMESNGYRVLEASDPLEAQTVAGNCHHPIHLLITDVVMPKASGPQLAKQLVKLCPGLKVLYMSGYTERAISKRGVRGKEVAFLRKPFTPDELIAKVREVLENGGRTNHASE